MQQVLHAFANPFAFRQSLPDIWSGFLINVHMMVVAEALVLVLALLIAIVRGLPGRGAKPLRGLAIMYTDFFRGTPLTIVAYACILGLPGLGYAFLKNASSEELGIIALTIVYTAYVTEVYRAGIESVHDSQRMAARSLGLSYGQALRYVILPQAIRRVIPPLLNDFIGLQKDTAIIGAIGVTEAAAQGTNFANSYFNYTGYFVAAVFFIYLTIPLARFTDHIIRERERRERAVGA
ncbi:MAG TPA: amino acid ABC transporter permease [Gaiellaceae bacterium]|nr:amino acid ABC transporter permease [Gaiellaceae bacterium]